MKTLLSFVIPCYGSEGTIEEVIEEIIETVSQRAEAYDYEIICVDDCSPDNVLTVLTALASRNPKIKVIELARNMGKHAAVMAGFSLARGAYIVNLDDDFQSPVYELWRLLEPVEKGGYDVSSASYKEKKESAFKRFGSKVNEFMARELIGQPKDVKLENFEIMKRFVVDEIIKYKNPYPYLGGLLLRVTRKIAVVEMEERERLAGRGGYNFIKSLKLFANGFTAFSVKPLRAATVVGSVCAFIGFIMCLYTIIHRLLYPSIISGYSSLMAVLLFIGGLIMVMLGLIGEYVGRIYICINDSPQYVIRNTINAEGSETESFRKKKTVG